MRAEDVTATLEMWRKRILGRVQDVSSQLVVPTAFTFAHSSVPIGEGSFLGAIERREERALFRSSIEHRSCA
jgi:hypothetical protein